MEGTIKKKILALGASALLMLSLMGAPFAYAEESSNSSSGTQATSDTSSSSATSGTKTNQSSDSQKGNTSGTSDSSDVLDHQNLPDGTYTVAVTLQQASNLSQGSMGRAALMSPATLTVSNKQYSLALDMSGVVHVMDINGHCTYLGYYTKYTVGDNALTYNSDSLKDAATFDPAAEKKVTSVPVDATGKSTGYVAVAIKADAMGDVSQAAAVHIDWNSLKKVSDQAQKIDNQGTTTNVDNNTNSNSNSNSNSNTNTNSNTNSNAGVNTNRNSGQTARNSGSQATTTQRTTVAPGTMQAGHLYAVSLHMYKSGSNETSMSNTYIGNTAYILWNGDGTMEVRFTTNRSDYIGDLRYNGSSPRVLSSSGLDRTFAITVPAQTGTVVIPIEFYIIPMAQLGVGWVSADMHLEVNASNDMGGDSGQVPGGGAPGTDNPLGTSGANGTGGAGGSGSLLSQAVQGSPAAANGAAGQNAAKMANNSASGNGQGSSAADDDPADSASAASGVNMPLLITAVVLVAVAAVAAIYALKHRDLFEQPQIGQGELNASGSL